MANIPFNVRILPYDDFEALITIYTPEQGGRKTPAFNGIKWDFSYAEDSSLELYMIYPDFFDETGCSLPVSEPLPINVELKARMWIVVDEMRIDVHRNRLKVGTEFYCHEGPKAVARGVVTKLTGLFTERPST